MKRKLRNIGLVVIWLVITGGMIVLLVAAISRKNHRNCQGVEIRISGAGPDAFLDRKAVLQLLGSSRPDSFKGTPLLSFDLRNMEGLLARNVWVKDAEMFFDNNAVLQIRIEEREPLARVFTTGGSSFYLDSSCQPLPLNDRMHIKLPVFTNFPTSNLRLHGKDSFLAVEVKHLALFIRQDSFWNAQIAQVEITPQREFELIPVVGNQLIELGNGEDLAGKFHRLLLFYQQVMSKTGLEKYSVVDVRFANQVVGTRKGTVTKIDAALALKNIQRMIEASREMKEDTVSTLVDNNILVSQHPDTTLTILVEQPDKNRSKDSLNKVPPSTHPPSLKNHPPVPSVKRKVSSTGPHPPKPRPRAVMGRTG